MARKDKKIIPERGDDETTETTSAVVSFTPKATKLIRRTQADRITAGKPTRSIPWIVNHLLEGII